MQYRPDMTPEEHAAFQAELAALDRAYAEAAQFDAARAAPADEEGEEYEEQCPIRMGWVGRNGRP